MSARFRFAPIMVLLFVPLVAPGANACDLYRDEVFGVWRGTCNLTLDPKGPKLLQEFVGNMQMPLRLKLPDLVIDKYKFYLDGTELEIFVDVSNLGLQTSLASNFGVTVTNVATGATVPLPLVSVPALAPGTTRRVFVARHYVDNSAADVDFVFSGMVDQLTAAQPVRGPNYEANETNNALIHMCRVYGPTPNPSLGSCN